MKSWTGPRLATTAEHLSGKTDGPTWQGPMRWFRELTEMEAHNYVELMLEEKPIADTLSRFLQGKINGPQLAHEIQQLAENLDEALKEFDAMEAFKDAEGA